MVDERNTSEPGEAAENFGGAGDAGIDAPEPADLEPPVMPEPEPVLTPPAASDDFEPSPPPPPPSGPAPSAYPPPPPLPPQQGQYSPPSAPPASAKSRVTAGILAILLGAFGVHKFYLGYKQEGVIMAAVWAVGWLTAGVISGVVALVGLIEGIIYLTKTDEDFYQTYVAGRKPWF